MNKPLRLCTYPGCNQLVTSGRCDKHAVIDKKDRHKGSPADRGYTYRWQKYSRWFLSQPENVFCKLQLPGCTNLAGCVDHIDPPDGSNDPRFWDTDNHQAACIHCNSVKGHRKIVGKKGTFGLNIG